MKRISIVLTATALVLAICLPAFAAAKIEGKVVTYKDGDVILKGYLALDQNIKGERPGVLIVHEWLGT